MGTLTTSSSLPHRHPISRKSPINTPSLQIPSSRRIPTSIPGQRSTFTTFTAISPAAPSVEEAAVADVQIESEKFDWYSNWFPVMPVSDLDKRRPHGKKVIGIDIVVWWDKNDNSWKVFGDSCPHRLAPLSEGRIDQWGRLQCVYHGWCFGGAGDCKLIPQAPRNGPPVETSKKACAAVYPSCVQNGIVWFWPNTDPEYKHIYSKKKPPYIPELDDPSYTNFLTSRELPYGYEVLIENLMDPAHIPYAHYDIVRASHAPERRKAAGTTKAGDREGGTPVDISIKKVDINGFHGKQPFWDNYFVAPCLYYGKTSHKNGATANAKTTMLIFYCIPVSPGHSRLIFSSPRNFNVWLERITPRWMFHMEINTILDSDLYLLYAEESKLKEFGPLNWQKACYVPTKSDAMVVGYRRWLNKYGGTQVDWKNKHDGLIPSPTPPREQLLDRYWSHTVNCSSCSVAYKQLNALEIGLQVISIASIGIVAAAKQGAISIAARYSLISMAVLCFLASKWVSNFAYKTFRYHDYDHAFA